MTDEEKANKGTAPTATDSDNGIQPSSDNLIERASKEREGLKAENERLEKNLKELRELTARQMLGGGSPAGQPAVKAEETPQEYAKRIMAGKR